VIFMRIKLSRLITRQLTVLWHCQTVPAYFSQSPGEHAMMLVDWESNHTPDGN